MTTAPGRPLLITMGDAAGIGPEVIVRACVRGDAAGCVVVGDLDVMRRAIALRPEWAMPVAVLDEPGDVAAVPAGTLPLLVPDGLPARPVDAGWGQVDARCGAAAARCIEAAVAWVRGGQAAGLVTAPIHKEALSAAGIGYPGHTEMLRALAAEPGHAPPPVRMMLANTELRVVLVTIHVSLRRALDLIDVDSVLQTIRITDAALRRQGLARPRLAVAGLNPHAGEGGLFGDEELSIIAPAIASACAEGIDARGPYAPDTVFMRARDAAGHLGEFDAVVAMTHDHGLIPVKYLGVDDGVNVTLGLPFVRTSPDHGTAFDIAGRGVASERSLVSAIRMARTLRGV